MNIGYMFSNCINLDEIIDLDNFNISHVYNTEFMFYNCKKTPQIKRFILNNLKNFK